MLIDQTIIDPFFDENVDLSDIDTILFESENPDIDISKYLGKTKFVPLETKANCLIGSIDRIMYDKEHFFIQNNTPDRDGIFMYDKKGRFLSKIENVGRGPGEYIKLNSFDIDLDGNIYVSDYMRTNKLIVYDKSMRFIREITMEASVYSFCIFNGKIYGYSARSTYKNNYKYLIVVMDMTGKVCNKFFPYSHESEDGIIAHNNIFIKNRNLLYINMPFSELIYEVDIWGKVKGRYCLIYMKEDLDGNFVNRFQKYRYKHFYVVGNKIIVQTTTGVDKRNEYSSYLVGLSNGRENVFINNVRENLDKGILTSRMGQVAQLIVDDAILVFPLEALVFSEGYKNENVLYKGMSRDDINKLKNVKEDDNPILIFNPVL